MRLTTRPGQAITPDQTPIQSLFACDIEDRVLLSCHLLGKPTSDQLYRLHADQVASERSMRRITAKLSGGAEAALAVIKPLHIENTSLKLPHIYLDTTRSRRRLEKIMGIPFRRPTELPSRDWRFLRHDVTLVDELISFELTARAHQIPFGYESHFDEHGSYVYPYIEITDGTLQHKLQPRPDKTLIVGNHHLIIEHDCGEETVALGNIIRDATLARKHLVYDQLERSGSLDDLGWVKRLYLYVIDAKRSTQKSSRKRVKRCLETLPAHVNPHRVFFVDRQAFMEAGNDISAVQWVRGDGSVQTLPCWG